MKKLEITEVIKEMRGHAYQIKRGIVLNELLNQSPEFFREYEQVREVLKLLNLKKASLIFRENGV